MLPLLALLLLVAPTDTIRHPTVVVVRHTEKASETERDPTLSDAGRVRAAALDSALADAHVVAILVTQYRRSVESAALVATRHQITPIVISTDGGVAAHAAAMARAAKNLESSSDSWIRALTARWCPLPPLPTYTLNPFVA